MKKLALNTQQAKRYVRRSMEKFDKTWDEVQEILKSNYGFSRSQIKEIEDDLKLASTENKFIAPLEKVVDQVSQQIDKYPEFASIFKADLKNWTELLEAVKEDNWDYAIEVWDKLEDSAKEYLPEGTISLFDQMSSFQDEEPEPHWWDDRDRG